MEQAVSENQYLQSKLSWGSQIMAFVENYGWWLLILAVAILYVLRKFQPTIQKYFKDQDDKEYAAKYHKNPDLFAARAAAQDAAVQRLQEKYAQDAAEFQQKMEEKEAKKREEWLARNNGTAGHKLGSGSANKEKNTLRPDHNPLMGGGSGYTYRPPRRSPCSGGGCGR